MAVKSGFVAIVSDEFTNPNTVNLLNEVTRQLHARDQIALLINVDSRENFQTALRNIASLPVDGVLFLTSLFSDELAIVADILPRVRSVHLSHSDSANASVIVADGMRAGQQVAQLLLSQGHQRFGYLQALQMTAPDSLLNGYEQELQQQHKAMQVQLTAGGHAREQAYQAVMAYLKKTRAAERIQALFCASDALAFGALQAVRDFGQGSHVAVVGVDDTEEARASTWHLTSWAPRRDLLVAEALRRLLDQQSDGSNAWQQGELQVRHSHLGKYVPGEMSQCGCAIRH